MLQCMMENHNVMPELLSVVRCFQDKTSNCELAFSGTSWKRCTRDSKGVQSSRIDTNVNAE